MFFKFCECYDIRVLFEFCNCLWIEKKYSLRGIMIDIKVGISNILEIFMIKKIYLLGVYKEDGIWWVVWVVLLVLSEKMV